jgi:phenylacetate-CoA ligase
MVIVRGANLYPSAVEEILRSCGVTEFRVEIFTARALTEMRIEIEPATNGDDPARLADRAAAALNNAFGFRVVVSCVPSGALPRFEGKANRWVRR